MKELLSAIDFAAYKHRFQKRKGAAGVPYINHTIEVAKLLSETVDGAEINLLIAAVLHDIIEDTDTLKAELENKFGIEVANIVDEVTDDMSLPSSIRKKLQVDKAETLSYEARCVKIADKVCNVRDILFTRIKWSRRRKLAYIIWAIQVVEKIKSTNPELSRRFEELILQAESLLSEKFNFKP